VKKFRQSKYNWPDDPEIIRDLGDDALKKLWRYAPKAKNKHEAKCSCILCDELINRGLK
jgi:hypothetical protein